MSIFYAHSVFFTSPLHLLLFVACDLRGPSIAANCLIKRQLSANATDVQQRHGHARRRYRTAEGSLTASPSFSRSTEPTMLRQTPPIDLSTGTTWKAPRQLIKRRLIPRVGSTPRKKYQTCSRCCRQKAILIKDFSRNKYC